MAFGDRKDGKLLRHMDSLHFIVPVICPNRCDNEAFIYERIDLSNIDKFLVEKNKDNPEYKYNFFQIIVTAMLKTLTLRPKMNYFIANNNVYERKSLSASFVVKKQFADNGEEGLAFVIAKPENTLEDIHNEIYRQITNERKGDKNSTSKSMDIFEAMPRFLSKWLIRRVMWLDRHGWVPSSFISNDPFYSSVLLSNLGSIKLNSAYHHLNNWGTNSVFVAVGEIKKRPFYDENGNLEMKNSVDLGITIDERLADGYYYSKTIKLLKHLLENPELLLEPLNKEVNL